MNTNGINYLNVALMLLSFGLAILLPFELFLFSYAVLGPLHYLTEINWLHERDYFMPRKRDFWLLAALGGAVFLLTLSHWLPRWGVPLSESGHQFIAARTHNLVIASLVISFVMMCVANARVRLGCIAVSLGLAAASGYASPSLVGVAIFIPTLVHVWLFTGLFLLTGALRGRHFSGYLAVATFAACSVGLFFIRRDYLGYPIGAYVQRIYAESELSFINANVFNLIGRPGGSFAMNMPIGLSIQSFIAFAYTYHYLNWFSKTGVIGWHRVPKGRLLASVGVWLAAVGLYAYDYLVGLTVLLFLSLLHVFLEFPLNHRMLSELAGLVTGKGRSAGATPAPATAARKPGGREKTKRDAVSGRL
jgi:hypothetical protein